MTEPPNRSIGCESRLFETIFFSNFTVSHTLTNKRFETPNSDSVISRISVVSVYSPKGKKSSQNGEYSICTFVKIFHSMQ